MESLAAPVPMMIADLAVTNPKVAYALVLGVPRAPILLNLHASFATGAPNTPIEADLATLTDDVWIRDVVYTVQRPNAYLGNILKEQSDFYNQAIPGVSVKIIAGTGPKYLLSPDFVPLQNLAAIFERDWKGGWTLDAYSILHAEFVLTKTLFDAPGNSEIPYDVDITFHGIQFFDRFLQKITDQDARDCLRKMGFWVPDLQCVNVCA